MKINGTLSAALAAVFVFLFINGASGSGDKGKIVPEQDIKDHKIIRLGRLGSISPPELTVEAGTTVIWVNDARDAVEIKFEGKQVTMACKSPVHFIVDSDGSFSSYKIPQGSVASLCMVEKGEFNYLARKVIFWGSQNQRLESPVKEFRGKIIVK